MGGGKRCLIRRNLVRDMVQIGSGYGVSAYYLDEKCQECVVAENVALDVPHPAQNHMTLNCELRNNVFICQGDIKIAFARCSAHKVTGNTFHLEGKLNIVEPEAITEWKELLGDEAIDLVRAMLTITEAAVLIATGDETEASRLLAAARVVCERQSYSGELARIGKLKAALNASGSRRLQLVKAGL